MAGDERIDNQISGRVADGAKSVQARDIDGGMQEVAQHAEASGGAAIQQAGRDVNNTFTIVSSLPSASSRVVPLLRESAPPGFTGRGDELAALTAGLDNVGGQDKPVVIVVVSGPGGIGKTELALHWAYQHCGWFPDGQLFVDLSGFAHNGTPLPQGEAVRLLLSALGVASTSIPADLEDRVVRYHNLVAGKRMLIVLDNARDVSQVTGLLPGTGTCTVLITSRDRMDGLAVAYGARLLPVGVLGDSDARTLLARRVGQSRVDAAPEAVTELLRRCAGLPLALRIVASRTAAHPDFTLAVLATELRDVATRLGALDTGDPATTVEAVMSWSYDALTPEQARVFTLLGIAPGPDISLDAAARLTNLSPSQARLVLRALDRVSLVDEHAPGRYKMHDLIRLYAANQATHDQPEDDREAALRRLVDFYLHTADTGDRLLRPLRDPVDLDPPVVDSHPLPLRDANEAWQWFDTERACLEATLQLAHERDWCAASRHLAWFLGLFSFGRCFDGFDALVAFGAELDSAFLQLVEPDSPGGEEVAAVLARSSDPARIQQAHARAEQVHRAVSQARTHHAHAWASEQQGDDQLAWEHVVQAVHAYQSANDFVGEADALIDGVRYVTRLGHYDEGRGVLEHALTLTRPQDRGAEILRHLAHLACHTGNYTDALAYCRQALALLRDAANPSFQEAPILECLGDAYAALGQHDRARDGLTQAQQAYQADHRLWIVIEEHIGASSQTLSPIPYLRFLDELEPHQTPQHSPDADRVQQKLDTLDEQGR